MASHVGKKSVVSSNSDLSDKMKLPLFNPNDFLNAMDHKKKSKDSESSGSALASKFLNDLDVDSYALKVVTSG